MKKNILFSYSYTILVFEKDPEDVPNWDIQQNHFGHFNSFYSQFFTVFNSKSIEHKVPLMNIQSQIPANSWIAICHDLVYS